MRRPCRLCGMEAGGDAQHEATVRNRWYQTAPVKRGECETPWGPSVTWGRQPAVGSVGRRDSRPEASALSRTRE
jgi:hypothetical protein